MIQDTVPHFPGQIQSHTVLLETFHHTHALLIVPEASHILRDPVQCSLPRVTKRRMTQIMSKCDRLRKILIELQRSGDGSCILRNLQRMRHTRPVVVALRCQENLRFLL